MLFPTHQTSSSQPYLISSSSSKRLAENRNSISVTHTLEFVLASVDEGGRCYHVAGKIVDHRENWKDVKEQGLFGITISRLMNPIRGG